MPVKKTQTLGSPGPRYGEGVAGPAVAVRDVRVGYGSFPVLEGVDLTVDAGATA